MRLAIFLTATTFGCATYDAPPEAELALPSGGTYEVGASLQLAFSEPVAADSLRVRVWSAAPEDRTVENEHRPGLTPTVDTCGVATEGSSCPKVATFALADDGLSATLELSGPEFAAAKVPWQLEVLSGLQDRGGKAAGIPYYFDFQFAPAIPDGTDGTDGTDGPAEPVEFTDGVYLLVAPIEDPLPVTLQMYFEAEAMDDGRFAWAGGKGIAKAGFAKNTSNPDELHVDVTGKGFAVFPVGRVTKDGDARFVATEPFDIFIDLAGIGISLSGVRVTGAIVEHPTTGEDRIEGTISFEKLTLDAGEPFDYPAGNAPFAMTQLHGEKIPENIPRLCGDLCGGVTVQCNPPEGFPGAPFCGQTE